MAALYLHQALFATEPSTPIRAHRSLTVRSSHDRHLSSVSSATLRTSNSDHSQPTEPLLHPLDSESSVYLDLLSRQPQHPAGPENGSHVGLSLEGDPVTLSERRSLWERVVRRRLRRLRWAKRILLAVIGAWGVYNTVRYYVAFTVYPFRTRQIFALALGTSTAVSLAFIVSSLIIAAFAPHLGWIDRPRAPHVIAQCVLNYCSSVLLLAPAVVNFVLVFVWRHSSDVVTAIAGRCHWDIDVVWSSLGARCAASPAWGFWVAGSLVRMLITFAFLAAYHLISYTYDVTRQPSRRKHGLLRPRSAHSFPSATNTSLSSRSFRNMMASSASVPVSITRGPLSPARSLLDSPQTPESGPRVSGPHPLRKSHSRIMAQSPPTSAGSADGYRSSSSTASSKHEDNPATPRAVGNAHTSPDSSDESLETPNGNDDYERYGRQIRRIPGAYASVPPQSPQQAGSPEHPPPSSYTDRALSSFVDHFRSLVDQVTHEGDVAFAPIDLADYARPLNNGHDRHAADVHVPVLGRTVHRMPTIESLGSREVLSLASSSGHHGRRSTRSNTVNSGDSHGTSSPRSRANSWDAALALAAPEEHAENGVGEFGQLQASPVVGPGETIVSTESKSTGSYHTAQSTPLEKLEDDR
ncbi:hypothetical protein B0H21DRAFT_747516 [Amylocystis lapponica]|nr:hypothetical protein B0H21DRAFT_747516 [Amylocystis lapponica]